MKKRILSIVLALGLVFSLCACGGPTPTSTVDSFLSALKAQDSETINSVYAGDDFDFTEEMDMESDGSQPETDKVLSEKLWPMMMEYDYTLANEQINEDKATVDVTITTYGIGATLLTAELEKLTEKKSEKTATISLTATEEGWEIDEIDDEGDFMNALTGGMVSSMKSIENAFE